MGNHFTYQWVSSNSWLSTTDRPLRPLLAARNRERFSGSIWMQREKWPVKPLGKPRVRGQSPRTHRGLLRVIERDYSTQGWKLRWKQELTARQALKPTYSCWLFSYSPFQKLLQGWAQQGPFLFLAVQWRVCLLTGPQFTRNISKLLFQGYCLF